MCHAVECLIDDLMAEIFSAGDGDFWRYRPQPIFHEASPRRVIECAAMRLGALRPYSAADAAISHSCDGALGDEL